MSNTVLYEQDGAVVTLTLNRPESLNSMSADMLDLLWQLGQRAAEDDTVRCVVITGAGRAFTAGGDVKAMTGRPAADGAPAERPLVAGVGPLRQQEEISRLLQEMPKPTIAAVNGHAVGAGLSIALAADLCIASEQAKFSTAFSKIGVSGDFGGSWLLQRLVGPSKAKELYFFPDVFDAATALQLGIVTKVVPHDQLMAEATALAQRLAAGPTAAYARIKDNIAFGATNSFADTLTREAENMVAAMRTADHRNAALAFVEKREPTYEGR